jgi:hypothetical protein
MQTATLDFLEPETDSGKYRKESFEITNEDTKKLKEKIKKEYNKNEIQKSFDLNLKYRLLLLQFLIL